MEVAALLEGLSLSKLHSDQVPFAGREECGQERGGWSKTLCQIVAWPEALPPCPSVRRPAQVVREGEAALADARLRLQQLASQLGDVAEALVARRALASVLDAAVGAVLKQVPPLALTPFPMSPIMLLLLLLLSPMPAPDRPSWSFHPLLPWFPDPPSLLSTQPSLLAMHAWCCLQVFALRVLAPEQAQQLRYLLSLLLPCGELLAPPNSGASSSSGGTTAASGVSAYCSQWTRLQVAPACTPRRTCFTVVFVATLQP